jgi:hypothetical protein
MSQRHVISLLFLLSGSVLPVAVYAQQSDSKPNENQVQSPSTPDVQSQSTQVQPERTPQQSDQARQQDKRNADDTRINPNWTTRQGSDERKDMDRQRRADQDQDDRTVGRNWHRDFNEPEPSSRYRDEDRYYEPRPRRRIKTCVEYDNGDEYCHYRD